MTTTDTFTGNTPDLEADVKAVYEAFAAGRPVDPEVARRVRGRVAQIADETCRRHGELAPETINDLFQDGDEEV